MLGATVAKLRALAERADEVVVLAQAATPANGLPDNVQVRTFGAEGRLASRRPLRAGALACAAG